MSRDKEPCDEDYRKWKLELGRWEERNSSNWLRIWRTIRVIALTVMFGSVVISLINHQPWDKEHTVLKAKVETLEKVLEER